MMEKVDRHVFASRKIVSCSGSVVRPLLGIAQYPGVGSMTIDNQELISQRRREVENHIDRATCATIGLPEAATILGINRTTAWELIQQGEFPMPVLRVGKRYRVAKFRIAEYLIGVEESSSE